jgi:hypothetical protein
MEDCATAITINSNGCSWYQVRKRGEIKVNIGKIVKIGQKRKCWLELVDVMEFD